MKLDTRAADLPKRRYSRLGVFRLRSQVFNSISARNSHASKKRYCDPCTRKAQRDIYFAATESIANELRHPIPYIVGIHSHKAEDAMEGYVMRSGNPSNSRNPLPPYRVIRELYRNEKEPGSVTL